MSKQYWKLCGNTLHWKVQPGDEAHTDNYEMSGLYCDLLFNYGIDEQGRLRTAQAAYYPMLRIVPNNTYGSLGFKLEADQRPAVLENGTPAVEYADEFVLDGTLGIYSHTESGLKIVRRIFPSTDTRYAIELLTVTAAQDTVIGLSVENGYVHEFTKGTKGVYRSTVFHDCPETLTLRAGETRDISIFYTGVISNQTPVIPDGKQELQKRLDRVSQLCDNALVLESDKPELDAMVRFAKLRAGESIFDTLTGKYHSPGGRVYYAAIWCNDQIEYSGPHFGMTGDSIAIEAALNAYRALIPFMSDAYYPIPSSLIAECLDWWNGVGDRGDAAMYLYGASLFTLYVGDRKIAEELYPAICWCAEYCERQKTPEGVIGSDTDELENRFPTDGKANLSTSSLCYGGLLLAASLADDLGHPDTAALFRERAEALGKAIESHFGATLHGFDTYRYSAGIETLRAWICLPLCMGITNRAGSTLDAMLSPYLWTEEGMLTCEFSEENTSRTIWDRSTLYGMRCAFLCGESKRMMQPLMDYCHKRLVCDRVPYAVEAYPEGGKRHLSGESALFVRVVTEGMFGVRPESLSSFSFRPELPHGMQHMKLSSVRICGGCFDIAVDSTGYRVTCGQKVISQGPADGKRVTVCAQ